jgi:hypothetical protein
MGKQYRSGRGWSAFLTQLGMSYTRWLRRREKDKLVANHVLVTATAVVMIFVGSMVAQSVWPAIREGTSLTGVYQAFNPRTGQSFSVSILEELRVSAALVAGGVFWLWLNSFCWKRFSRRL